MNLYRKMNMLIISRVPWFENESYETSTMEAAKMKFPVKPTEYTTYFCIFQINAA